MDVDACHHVSFTDIIYRLMLLSGNVSRPDYSGNASFNGRDYVYSYSDSSGDSGELDDESHGTTVNRTAGTGSSELTSIAGYVDATPAWFRVVMPTISAVGIVGNLISIAVLTRRRLLSTMQHLERSVTHGLTALAVSDLLFCVAVLPQGGLFDIENNGDYGGAGDSINQSIKAFIPPPGA